MVELFPVLAGAESFYFKGSDIGILISHGFGGTPQSVLDLGEYIAAQGFTVYGPRLKGHGTNYNDLESSRCQDWFQSIEEGFLLLQQHCRTIFVIGQSMGGTLTIRLASKYPEIQGVVIINAAMSSIPVMEKFRYKQGPRFIDEGPPDIKAKDVYEITYTKTPIKSIQQLLSLIEDTCGNLQSVRCPILAFKSIEDHVVPPENTDYIMANIRSDIKEIIPLYNSYHVASMDNEKKFIAEQCCLFIAKHSNNQIIV